MPKLHYVAGRVINNNDSLQPNLSQRHVIFCLKKKTFRTCTFHVDSSNTGSAPATAFSYRST
jgi:hypothetical protein